MDASRCTASDEQVAAIVERFIAAGELAWQAGYAFVDVKHCHGYLGHEFLSAVDRPGRLRRELREPHPLSARGGGGVAAPGFPSC